MNSVHKCSKNCQRCSGTEKEKKNCPEWIVALEVLDINRKIKQIQKIIRQAMLQDLKAEIAAEIMVEDDDEDETYQGMERDHTHNKHFT